jgi:hypothetical protein
MLHEMADARKYLFLQHGVKKKRAPKILYEILRDNLVEDVQINQVSNSECLKRSN